MERGRWEQTGLTLLTRARGAEAGDGAGEGGGRGEEARWKLAGRWGSGFGREKG